MRQVHLLCTVRSATAFKGEWSLAGEWDGTGDRVMARHLRVPDQSRVVDEDWDWLPRPGEDPLEIYAELQSMGYEDCPRFAVRLLGDVANQVGARERLAQSTQLAARVNPHGGSERTIDLLIEAPDPDAAGHKALAKVVMLLSGLGSNFRVDRVVPTSDPTYLLPSEDPWDKLAD